MQPSGLEVYFLQLVNDARSAAGVAPLTLNGELVGAAGGHSDWMVAQDVFSHAGAGGSSPGDRIVAAGYGASAWGENVAYIAGLGADVLDQADVETLHANLMNSSGHRANILSANFTEIGIGLAQGDYHGMPAVFVTEDFGAPNAAQAAEWDPISGAAAPAVATAVTSSFASPAPSTATGSVTLRLSEDAWLEHAQYTVSLDGAQVGGVRTATASHSAGAHEDVLLTDLASGQHTIGVTFLNDAWGGTATTDRNLYVDGISVDGHDVAGATASLFQEGTATYNLDIWA